MDNPFMSTVSSTFSLIANGVHAIPGSAIAIDYIKNSYQNDPFRVVLELALAVYAVKYMLSKKYRIDTNDIQLTEKVSFNIYLSSASIYLHRTSCQKKKA